MTVIIIASLGGGGGSDLLDEYVDDVTFSKAAVTYDLGPVAGLVETMTSYNTDIDTDPVTFSKDTAANQGLAYLQTLPGFWNGVGYSGSGNWLNSGILGAALDFVPGAATAAPTWASNIWTFDGSNDYMSIADADALDFLGAKGFSLGVIMTPKTAIVSGAAIMGKYSGSSAGYALAMASTTTYRFTVADSSATTNVGTQTCAVNTKQLFAGGRDTQVNMFRATTDKVVATAIHTQATIALTANGSAANALAFTLGARPGLTNFCQMDVFGAFLAYKPLAPADLINIAAYYGV